MTPPGQVLLSASSVVCSNDYEDDLLILLLYQHSFFTHQLDGTWMGSMFAARRLPCSLSSLGAVRKGYETRNPACLLVISCLLIVSTAILKGPLTVSGGSVAM